MLQTVINVVGWCRTAGIQHLTVYEEHGARLILTRSKSMLTDFAGALLKFSQRIRDAFPSTSEELSSDSDIEYPLTPPPSDYSESRPISPQHNHTVTIRISDAETPPSSRKGLNKRKSLTTTNRARHELTLSLISRESSKPAIAAVAQSLASRMKQKARKSTKLAKSDPYTLSVHELANLLELHDSPVPPDFMIVHSLDSSQDLSSPLELHGYPPWQVRLTEIYHNRAKDAPIEPSAATRPPTSKYAPLSEVAFDQALSEYAAAEMRFGK
ncbi:hypothetical protein H0H92_012025 [Tricholoma furcatifolium]|nr:hypothetical protein H0H92_012025 [Tricholoma furcatifolium]